MKSKSEKLSIYTIILGIFCQSLPPDHQQRRGQESVMSRSNISTIPEELRQEITSYLNYHDAWSLKQTSRLFYRVVEIPTIQSFLACPYGPSLAMLEEWEIIPLGHEACHYCKRVLPNDRFSRFQRCLTAARQNSLSFNYATWNPKRHYCLECGVQNDHYPRGTWIDVGFGDPGFSNEAVMPCQRCGKLIDFLPMHMRGCQNCTCLWLISPGSSVISSSSVTSIPNPAQEPAEPKCKAYRGKLAGALLALIGERLQHKKTRL